MFVEGLSGLHLRHWDPRGLIDRLYESKRRQRAAEKQLERLRAKLLEGLGQIANMNDGVRHGPGAEEGAGAGPPRPAAVDRQPHGALEQH